MNWKRTLGLDNLSEEYAFARNESTGYTSAKKIPDHWVPTTCGYCSVGCGIEIGVKDGHAVASRPFALHPVNRGKLCPKGLSEHYIIDTDNRAKYPLLRKSGKLVRVGWDEALDVMVERFRATQAKYGAESFGVLSTGQLVTEEFYTLGKLVQLGFGTNNYDGNTTLCMASAVSGYKISFGSDGPPGAYEDMERADVVLLIGANLADNHPILCQYLEANRNKTLIVADPRVSKTAMMADMHLPLKPRSDLALLNGIAYILIRYNLVDRDYVEKHTTGFADLERFLEAYTPERVAKQLYVRFKGLGPSEAGSLQVGRFEFNDGSELVPKNATLATLKRDRISQRLIGTFGWSDVGRSFDGGRFSYSKPTNDFTFVAAIPTRGVFQTDGWGWNRVGFGYASFTHEWGHGKHAADTRVFVIDYDDWRHILKTDNRPVGVRARRYGKHPHRNLWRAQSARLHYQRGNHRRSWVGSRANWPLGDTNPAGLRSRF